MPRSMAEGIRLANKLFFSLFSSRSDNWDKLSFGAGDSTYDEGPTGIEIFRCDMEPLWRCCE